MQSFNSCQSRKPSLELVRENRHTLAAFATSVFLLVALLVDRKSTRLNSSH